MKHSFIAAGISAALIWAAPVLAGSASVDFQPTGGTTAPGTMAFENTNQVLPDAAGVLFTVADQQAAGGSDIGSDFTITLNALNLPDGATDFRSVTRNGAATESVNDWIGADSRNGGQDVTLQVTVSGLAAGQYSWLSTHHDGGSGVTNGNQLAPAVLTFQASGDPIVVADFAHSAGNGGNTAYSQFSTDFTTDGSPVSLSISVNDTGLADFAYINDLTLTQVPEPTGSLLVFAGLLGVFVLRRRK
ncbi:MAG: PEP-CTERM sorting domain-containing protein [Pirellulaceae bacterium]